MNFIRKTMVLFSLCALLAPHGLRAQDLTVVVSIKPIHSLVAGVMGDTGKPVLLLKGAASPHTYQMRPSEARSLNQAKLIVWIGENMETFLHRAIENLGSGATVVTVHETPRMRLLKNREGGIWEEDDHDEPHVDEDEDHGHEHGEYNMHLWLEPENARRIVDVVADMLIRVDPGRAPAYRANAEAMRKRITAMDSSLRERLSPVRGRAFVVFHDAYQYFERAYGLEGKGAVAVDPARAPSAKRLVELRAALSEHGIRCVFTEPQFEPDLVRTLVEGTEVKTAVLDPIGADIRPGPDAWFEVMRGLGDSISGCLGDG